MKTKMEQFPAKNPNPVLSAGKDGIVLYSNLPSEPLLHEWGVSVGKKLPLHIENIIHRVISLNSTEKIEVNAGNRIYLVSFHPLPEEECVNIYGFDISDQKELEDKLRESKEKYHNIVEKPMSYETLLDENHALQDENRALQGEMQSLRARLEEAEELRRAISEGDLDALVIPRPEGELIFTLHSADQAYLVLVETMNEGTATLAFNGRILYCNRRFAELLKIRSPTIIGTSIYRFIEPENEITFKTLLKHKMNTGEFNLKAEDDESVPVYLSISSLQMKGSPNAWCLVVTDLKKLKKAEEKIQNLANIVEYSNDAIITKSLDGIITSWNKSAEQIYGYSAEEVVGKPISILEPSILVKETEELAELIKQGDNIHSYETLRLRKDGTIINVSLTLSPVYDASGELTAITVIARNITKSKNAEKELQQSEERYRIVTEQTGQMVYDYDLRTNKSKWAGAIEEITGYNFEEFQKLAKDFWTENILDSDLNRVYEKSKDKETRGRFKEELRLRRKDGTYGYIENSGVYLMDNYDQPYRAI
jgi:PAS domain S-box-containing protein